MDLKILMAILIYLAKGLKNNIVSQSLHNTFTNKGTSLTQAIKDYIGYDSHSNKFKVIKN